MNMLEYKGVVFDDFVESDYGVWSQICDSCVNKHGISQSVLSTYSGSGICDVKGCENEADYYIEFPNDCTKTGCGYGVGWIVSEPEINVVEPSKIIITTDGKITLARLFSGNRVIDHAKAVCSQEDEFSFIVGSNLAFSRLLNKMMFPHAFNGKTVFFKNDAWGFTYGEVYTFVNGFTKDDYGTTFPYSGLSITDENDTRLRDEGFIAFNTTKEE